MRFGFAFLVAMTTVLHGQQPFYTDDADTTARGQFHFEWSNQFSILQRSNFPALRQNADVFQLNYGVTDRLEMGVDSPLLTIFNAPGTAQPRVPVGVGDTNITMKLAVRKEPECCSRWPAITFAFAVETPTGNPETQLGSGLPDYGINSIIQKKLPHACTLRVNNGLLFSGNTLTGVVGLAARGLVYFGGMSVTRQFSRRLLFGIETNGAYTREDALGKGQVQMQVGGKWRLGETSTFDFGVIRGRLANSPRLGLQVGLSTDFALRPFTSRQR